MPGSAGVADPIVTGVLTTCLAGKMERSHCAKVGADAWFDRYDASWFELTEQSIRIGGKVLTFLVIEDGEMLEDAGAGPHRRW